MAEGWKDVTPLRQSRMDEGFPTWMLKIGGLSIVVTRYYGSIPRKEWLLMLSPYHLRNNFHGCIDLGTEDVEKAKVEALRRVRKMLRERIDEDTKSLDCLMPCDMCQEYAVIETIGNGSKSYKCLACEHLDVEDESEWNESES